MKVIRRSLVLLVAACALSATAFASERGSRDEAKALCNIVIDHIKKVGFDKAGHAENGVIAQFERVAEVIIHAAQNHIDLFQPINSFEMYAAVTHGQVRTLHESESQIARDVGVFVFPRHGAGPAARLHRIRVVNAQAGKQPAHRRRCLAFRKARAEPGVSAALPASVFTGFCRSAAADPMPGTAPAANAR